MTKPPLISSSFNGLPIPLVKYAQEQDVQDEFVLLRSEFELPLGKVYLCGNSLGPLPRRARGYMQRELDKWSSQGVEGHFLQPNPWVSIDEINLTSMKRIVGAETLKELAIMNSLTVNIHLLLESFYQPNGKRTKILLEINAFPSDTYAVESHIRTRNLSGKENMVQVDLDKLIERIEQDKGETICLVFLGGVNYQTGQVLDMENIAKLCSKYDIVCGFDLAHAVGNVELQLSAWGVDFACWCSYKYLNSGPGGIAGVFIHKKHHDNQTLNRFEGWWGSLKKSRFQMSNEFTPDDQGASAWQLSNPPVFQSVALRASMDVFDRVPDLKALFAKSRKLTSFLERCLRELLPEGSFGLLTPPLPFRGCQLSIVFLDEKQSIGEIHARITELGFICDKREPNIMRVAPAPLFNSFQDVLMFAAALKQVLEEARMRSKM